MQESSLVQPPTRRPAFTTRQALVVCAFVFLPLVVFTYAWKIGSVDLMPGFLIFAIAGIGMGVIGVWRKSAVPNGRRIDMNEGMIQQTVDGGRLVAEIDASKPYQYQTDRLGYSDDAIVRLYQDDILIEFYLSDPGATDLRELTLRFPWPPPPNPKR